MKRTRLEKIFVGLFIPSMVSFYLLYKYPLWFVDDLATLMPLGKNLSFWYALVYTMTVDYFAVKILIQKINVYSVNRKKPGVLNSYQTWKFSSIVFVQTFVYFLIPFVISPILSGADFWNDAPKLAAKSAHVYVYPAFTSWGIAAYVFIVIPIVVWFFGKRYCTWFCSCGNLAEVIGTTPWGKKWVQNGTPRGLKAKIFEHLSTIILFFSVLFGLILFLDGIKIITSPGLVEGIQNTQDLLIDFLFGSAIGIGAYPFLGTRVWCRYGCPLAKGMQLFGKITRSRFKVSADENCKGYGLCTRACPMGIDVAGYAHKDRKPILGSFGLEEPCIGCGGCISICPVDALKFGDVQKQPE
ncbi:MAG: 4Fe-4S binding protein [Fidelibacterota bacterium]